MGFCPASRLSQRPRSARGRVHITLAALIVIAGLAITGFGPLNESALSQLSPRSAPAGFRPSSFTAVSTSHWWVLGTVRCGTSACSRLETTTNAGKSFQALPTPTHRLIATTSPLQVAFANAEDGWLFGPKLWATHDGGHHWKSIQLPGTVSALEVGSAKAFAVVTPPEPPCYKTGRCTAKSTPKAPLWQTQIGSDDWSADPGTRAHGASEGLAVHGRSVWVIDTQNFADGLAIGTGLLHSSDSGKRFSVEPQAIGGIGCSYTPVSDSVLWDYCSGGHFMFAGRSVDAGAHFRSVDPEASNTTTPNGYPNGSTLAAASSVTAVAASDVIGRSELIQTSDTGSRWHAVQTRLNRHGYWEVLGFTTQLTGYALWVQPSATELWRTTNAGARWSRVKSLP